MRTTDTREACGEGGMEGGNIRKFVEKLNTKNLKYEYITFAYARPLRFVINTACERAGKAQAQRQGRSVARRDTH